ASVIGREFTRRLLRRLAEVRGDLDAVLREAGRHRVDPGEGAVPGDLDAVARLADQRIEIAVTTRSRKYESRARSLMGEAATARRRGTTRRGRCANGGRSQRRWATPARAGRASPRWAVFAERAVSPRPLAATTTRRATSCTGSVGAR